MTASSFGAQSEDATKRKEQKPPGGISAAPEHGPTENNAQTDYTRDTEKDDTQAKTSSHTQNNSEQAAELTTSDVTIKDYDDGDKLAAVDQSTERYTRAQKTSKPAAPRPPPPAFAFDGDDDEDDIEREISRQASKNKSLRKIEEQHKKAMEEDPSVFDYDGVYDEMKGKIAHPKVKDRTERKSKYIETLMEKAKQREGDHEIVYERKLLKGRSKDDHLFVDKEKFVISAYKKKIAEQEKWLDEERLRQIREERDDVTKKSDLSDFYFGLGENVAFEKDDTQAKTSSNTQNNSEQALELTTSGVTVKDYDDGDKLAAVDQSTERYTRGDDALASARERFSNSKESKTAVGKQLFRLYLTLISGVKIGIL
ncbi:uncharacterized protein LOC135644289 [Musa acuminata AAA Group]|uniref:uncharacterized protein LOC135644289 n=1 Tax=Musa acuminata AAA Group TaxID=214697 RepID=UPI0031D378D7